MDVTLHPLRRNWKSGMMDGCLTMLACHMHVPADLDEYRVNTRIRQPFQPLDEYRIITRIRQPFQPLVEYRIITRTHQPIQRTGESCKPGIFGTTCPNNSSPSIQSNLGILPGFWFWTDIPVTSGTDGSMMSSQCFNRAIAWFSTIPASSRPGSSEKRKAAAARWNSFC